MMNNGYIELPELLQQLQDTDELVYRMALVRDGDAWRVYTLFIDKFPHDPKGLIPSFDYDYGSAYFSAGKISGSTATNWLHQRIGEVTPPGKSGPVHRFTLQPLNGKFPWSRFPSYAPQDFHRMPRPMTRYEVTGFGGAQFQTDTGFLLSNDGPFFPDFRSALLQLVYMTKDTNAVPQTPSAAVIVRIADTSAWLSDITLSSTAVEVTISGTGTGGAQLSIVGAGERLFEQRNVASGTFNCPLPKGIPTPLWIMLSRGNEWLDYYHRDERWAAFNSAQQPNVTIDVGDARSEIETLILQGEGPEVEFKRELAADKKRILNTISAFANGAGGTILLGISDDGATFGVTDDPNSLRDTIIRTIRDSIVPMPDLHVTVHEREGKPIIAIYVGRSVTHACGVNPADPRYYVRRGASNFPARPEEITSIVLSRQPLTPINYLNQG